ncbi:MAG TPA: hypothetical protein DDW70_05475 [Rikenellaceae bacterium]|nr:hypothetical protein [Rikenellaceae bacterium]
MSLAAVALFILLTVLFRTLISFPEYRTR